MQLISFSIIFNLVLIIILKFIPSFALPKEEEVTLCFIPKESGDSFIFCLPPTSPEVNSSGLKDASSKKGFKICSLFTVS